MRITRYTDYSLRVLIYTAIKGEELSTIGEIATAYNISKNHLMKVVQELAAKNYLIATRGKNGGMRLRLAPEEINIGRLVRDMEQDVELVECFGSHSACVLTPACELKSVFAYALKAFFDTLEQYTLADLIPKNKQKKLMSLLNLAVDVSDISPTKSK